MLYQCYGLDKDLETLLFLITYFAYPSESKRAAWFEPRREND